ncbi:hypothetical protein FPQ18DRAFT_112923 [Pyronema domesticum]|nr:hypothetical protein FPQ18DRAFT_112923 [Pyronema domesticum]
MLLPYIRLFRYVRGAQPLPGYQISKPRNLPHIASSRIFSTTTVSHTRRVDDVVAAISRQYDIAALAFRDAYESSTSSRLYAKEDRETMKEELKTLELMFSQALVEAAENATGTEGLEEAEEIRRRVGGRLRELREGVGRVEAVIAEKEGEKGEKGKV